MATRTKKKEKRDTDTLPLALTVPCAAKGCRGTVPIKMPGAGGRARTTCSPACRQALYTQRRWARQLAEERRLEQLEHERRSAEVAEARYALDDDARVTEWCAIYFHVFGYDARRLTPAQVLRVKAGISATQVMSGVPRARVYWKLEHQPRDGFLSDRSVSDRPTNFRPVSDRSREDLEDLEDEEV